MANWTTLRQLSPSLSVKLVSCLLVTILFITPKTRRRGRKRSSSSPLPSSSKQHRFGRTKRNETKRKETKRNETKRNVASCCAGDTVVCCTAARRRRGTRGVDHAIASRIAAPFFEKMCAFTSAISREGNCSSAKY